jgi:hypothetical protein
MPTDPETALVLGAAVQRVARWTGAGTPPSPAAVVSIARQLEIAVHTEVVAALRRLREDGETWRVISSGLRRCCAPSLTRRAWRLTTASACGGRDCATCGCTITGYGPDGSPVYSQLGIAAGRPDAPT